MAKEKKFYGSFSPHVHSGRSTRKIMFTVIAVLLFPAAYGVYLFGLNAFLVIVVSVASAVLTELILELLFKKPVTVGDGSAALTGLLLAMCIAPNVPLWIPAVGSFFAIAVVKQAFGGLGKNIFNPALMARAFLLASWPVQMTTTWQVARGNTDMSGSAHVIDAISSATPLNYIKQLGTLLTSNGISMEQYSRTLEFLYDKAYILKLFIGNISGSIGETSALLLLLGGLFLIYKKIITWHIPATCIATMFIFTWIFGAPDGTLFEGNPVFHILAGGLFLGAFFMATDYVTSPLTPKGKVIFGTGCGILASVIRLWAGYPEGVCYSIIIMNAVTPLIDKFTKLRKFGYIKATGKS